MDLKLRKEEEINLIKKRKYENNKIFEDTKMDKKAKDNNNTILYQQMEQKFLERENKLIHDTENERGVKNLFYKNVKLPIINEKSKEESNWRKIAIKSLKGIERIN